MKLTRKILLEMKDRNNNDIPDSLEDQLSDSLVKTSKTLTDIYQKYRKYISVDKRPAFSKLMKRIKGMAAEILGIQSQLMAESVKVNLNVHANQLNNIHNDLEKLSKGFSSVEWCKPICESLNTAIKEMESDYVIDDDTISDTPKRKKITNAAKEDGMDVQIKDMDENLEEAVKELYKKSSISERIELHKKYPFLNKK